MKKLILLMIIIVIVTILFYELGISNMLNNVVIMKEYFNNLGFLGYLIFILLSIFISVFMLPGQFLAIIAGITYGGLWGGILTVIGATLGSSISFAIGKYFARDYIVRRFGKNPIFQKVEKGLKENGNSFLILTRLVPVFPFAIQSYAYAITPMKIIEFTIISFITMIPGSFIYAFMSSEIVEHGFSKNLIIEFSIAGVLLFFISFIPKVYAKKKKIQGFS